MPAVDTGRKLTAANEDGTWTGTYDAIGQRLTDLGPSHPNGAPLTSVYDPSGNRTALLTWRGTQTSSHDARSQNTLLVDIEGGRTSWSYEARGPLSTQQPPTAQNRGWSYDGNRRPTLIQNDSYDHEAHSYDGVGNVLKMDQGSRQSPARVNL